MRKDGFLVLKVPRKDTDTEAPSGPPFYPFLLEPSSNRLYIPDWGPQAFQETAWCVKLVVVQDWTLPVENTSGLLPISSALACATFHYHSHRYSQYWELPWPLSDFPGGYLTIYLYDGKDTEDPTSYIGSASTRIPRPSSTHLHIRFCDPWITNLLVLESNISIPTYLEECYGDYEGVETRWEVALVGKEDLYWISNTPSTTSDHGASFELTGFPFHYHHEYIEGLSLVAICSNVLTYKDMDGETVSIHADIQSDPLFFTPDLLAHWLTGPDNIEFPDTMTILRPRILDKTIQQVVNLTSQSDTKSNIIQPVFFRVQDLPRIQIHPEVTENIAINLDAYKSKVDRFYLKVEGISFPETARTSAGVIFQIQGSQLPGSRPFGTYYILDQDAVLVTSGQYVYIR